MPKEGDRNTKGVSGPVAKDTDMPHEDRDDDQRGMTVNDEMWAKEEAERVAREARKARGARKTR
jgi:hypothetical protein